MATIQLKRKTSSGTGPLTGSSGTVKQGEPLIVNSQIILSTSIS